VLTTAVPNEFAPTNKLLSTRRASGVLLPRRFSGRQAERRALGGETRARTVGDPNQEGRNECNGIDSHYQLILMIVVSPFF
jgi:hypothetical protein